jgi:galactokinase
MIDRLDYDGCLSDSAQLAQALARSGLPSRACGEKASLFRQAAVALQADKETKSTHTPLAFFVPGRIEVLGKHTDYAGGRSLLTATERGFAVVVGPRDDSRIRLLDVRRGQHVEFDLDPQLVPQAGHWSNYPMTVARRIARNFAAARRGMTFAFISDLPQAAGLSSSSALVVAVYLALEAVNELPGLPEYQQSLPQLLDLAGYLGAVENGQSFGPLAGDRGVGTFGGSEDHTAILTSRPGVLSQYAYRPVRLERTAALPDGYTFVVGGSGVVAEKTGGAREKYNRASRMVRKLEELWQASGEPGESLAEALAFSPDAVETFLRLVRAQPQGEFTADDLLARLEHFFTENEQIIPSATNALDHGDLELFGTLVDQSQRAAEDLLGNQLPETSYLATSARCRGAVAASAFGAGFGGSVWAMVESALVQSFLASWGGDYRDQFPEHAATATFFATIAGPAAFRVC